MAATNPIKLAVDRQNQELLTQLPLFAGSMPNFMQGDVRDLIVQVFDPGGVAAAPTPVDLTGYTMRVTIGIPGGPNPSVIYAGPLVMAIQPGNSGVTGNITTYFAGSLDLTGATLAAAMPAGENAELSAELEIDLRLNGVTQYLIQQDVTIISPVDQPNTVANPGPPNSYATTPENDARYVIKAPIPGQTWIMMSADGTQAAEFYLGNDGQPHFDPIVPPPQPAQ